MRFSKELQHELEERDTSLKVRGNRYVVLMAEDEDGFHHEVCDFVIQYGEWHMKNPCHWINLHMGLMTFLLSVMGELTKHSIENGVLDVPKFLI